MAEWGQNTRLGPRLTENIPGTSAERAEPGQHLVCHLLYNFKITMDIFPQEQAWIKSWLLIKITDVSLCEAPESWSPWNSTSPGLRSCSPVQNQHPLGTECTKLPYFDCDQFSFSDGFVLITSPRPVLAETHCLFRLCFC